MLAADGRVVWIAERETIVRDADGRPSFCHGVMFDITRLKTAEQRLMEAEAALREERDLAQRYLDVARTILLVLDADGSVRLLNQHGHELLGYPAGSLIGCDWFETVAAAGGARGRARPFAAGDGDDVGDRGRRRHERVGARRPRRGERRMIAWRHTLLRDRDGRADGRARVGRGHHRPAARRGGDPPARVPGSAHRARQPLAFRRRAARRGARAGQPVGLLFVDLDDFKQVNDTHGHVVGDELLRAVGERLAAARPASRLVGRHGGDEFLVLLPALDGDAPAAARAAAAAATARLAEPFAIAGHACGSARASAAPCSPHEAADADALLRAADAAMYGVKRRSRAPEAGR